MDLWVCQLGRVEYREALALQHRLREARRADRIPDTLLLLEHDPVYTRGRRSVPGELPLGEDWYRERGIEIVDVDRGGKVTYHGPGQLVGYPIMRIESGALAYVRTLEDAMVQALREARVAGARSRAQDGLDYTGVWVEDRKIASIGVHVQRGITTHGFAINVAAEALEPFEWIVPCGLGGVRMTSIAEEGGDADMACLRKRVAHRFATASGHRQRLASRSRILSVNAPSPAAA